MSLPIPPTILDRLMGAIRAIIRDEDPLRHYRGTWEYGVQSLSSSVSTQTLQTNYSIAGASNTSPIVITLPPSCALPTNGSQATIAGVLGNTAANGTWTVANSGGTQFTLVGSSGSGTYTSGGTASFTVNQPAVSANNTALDLVPTDPSIPMPQHLRNVPIRSGVPGFTGQPAVGSKVYVTFANGDPSKPIIVAYDPGASAGTNGFTPAPNGAVVCYGDNISIAPGNGSGVVTGVLAVGTPPASRSIRAT